jgi:asparagine synthase (glutamine-hydrolysing)
MEGPYKFLENSFWLKGILETAAQHDVGVLLNGARGNYTVSWGPAIDYYALLLRRLRWTRLYRELTLYSRRMGYKRSRLLRAIGRQAFPGMAGSLSSNRPPVGPQLIHPEFAARTEAFEKLIPHDVGISGSSMNEFQAREYQFRDLSVSNHYGVSSTKFSLRYRLWERDPTGDPRVIRFCLSIPVEQYIQNGIDRSLLRRATEGRLPDDVRMNQRVSGIQGADWIHRMLPNWGAFLEELKQLCKDPAASHYLNVAQIQESISLIGASPKPEMAYNPHARLMMQGLIAYRFLQRFPS